MNHKHYTSKDTGKLRLVNIVITFNLGCFINVLKLALKCKNIIAPPNEFAAGVGHLLHPKCVFFVFSTGSVIITGLKNISSCYLAAVMLCDIIKHKGGMKFVSINDYKITTLTLCVATNKKIDILLLKKDFPHMILDNEGRFPNIVWPSSTSSVSLCIFKKGHINVVGAKSIDFGQQAFLSAYPALKPYIT